MGKFDTHGGYFAPEKYFRINEGGSHDENPNGGVQIGTDEQGVPNMLEEGEPVYDDYVFSDNIKADDEFLKKHNIPSKYAGKLYSDIADDIVAEAEERPLDPISNNGLNAMLVRLADAQEEQKQQEQMSQLEDELSQLSPEELAELEQMLAQQGEVEQPQQPVAVSPEEQAMMQGQAMQEQPVMMARGGTLMRTFEEGTPGEIVEVPPQVDNTAVAQAALPYEYSIGPEPYTGEFLQSDIVTHSSLPERPSYFAKNANPIFNGMSLFVPEDATELVAGTPLLREAGRFAKPVFRTMGRGLVKIPKAIGGAFKGSIDRRKLMLSEADEISKTTKKLLEETKKAGAAERKAAQKVREAKAAVKEKSTKARVNKLNNAEENSRIADKEYIKSAAKTVGSWNEAAAKRVGAFTTGPMRNKIAYEEQVGKLKKIYDEAAKAAEANPTDELKAAASKALKDYESAQGTWNKWFRNGEWWWKSLIAGGAGIGAKEYSDHVKKENWKAAQHATGGPLNIYGDGTKELDINNPYKNWIQFPAGSVFPSYWTMIDGAPLEHSVADEEEKYDIPAAIVVGHRNQKPGSANKSQSTKSVSQVVAEKNPYGNSLPHITAVSSTPAGYKTDLTGLALGSDGTYHATIAGERPANIRIPSVSAEPVVDDESEDQINTPLPTGLRTVGAWIAGENLLSNIAQDPEKYDVNLHQPYLPYARIDLQRQRYRPVDINQIVNASRDDTARLARTLRDSGLGPSVGAALLAAYDSGTQATGKAMEQGMYANNQMENAVIANNNQAASQESQLNYNLDATRANALNEFAQRRAIMDFQRQLYEAQDRQNRYNAISGNLDAIGEALFGIGQENFVMNQINSNRALYDAITKLGLSYYKPSALGGPISLLKKYKK